MKSDSSNSVAPPDEEDASGSPGEAPGAAGVASAAIIMDGSGRWAAARGVSVAEGHREGARALRRTVEAAIDLGIESLAVYAFSTENWTRPVDEVADLMAIFGETIERELPDLAEQGVRSRFMGRRDRAPDSLREQMELLERETAANSRLDLWIAFDYGGRAELVEAVRRLVADGVTADAVGEEAIEARLAAPELLEPDLVIRTSGEQRLSNFMLWQAAYSEFVFSDVLWPDVDRRHLWAAIETYARRDRRYGSA
jgi:undecaprenyl diphosphate synthase